MNYNEGGLMELRKEIEQYYGIKLKFNSEFLAFPKFINEEEFKNINFEEKSEYFKKVTIQNISNNNILKMNENGEVLFVDNNKKENKSKSFIWYITIINNEITFYSNNFYLSIDNNNKNLKGYQYMVRWKYEKIEDKYLFYSDNKENILTDNKNKAIINKENENKINQLFKLLEE